MGAENDTKKRRRRFLPHNRPVKKKGPSPLRPGVIGFFITCDGGREKDASYEALNVIDSFFEELIGGKDTVKEAAAVPEKPLNKKITFTYSDSSDGEGGDDEDDDNDDDKEEKDSNLEGPAKDDTGNENPNGGNSDHDEKDDQKNDQSKETAGNDDEADKQNDDSKSKENEEPLAKKQCCDTKISENTHQSKSNTEKSVDRLIEDELKELGDKSKRRFSRLDTGCNGVVFILMRRREGDPGPREIVYHMMDSAARTKKHMSRFLLRVLPVEVSCYASAEEIPKAIKPVIDQYFPADAQSPVKFAVQYDARANSGIERMKIIDAVAKSVPAPHKVDLKNPDKTIIVQIIKTVCLVGVVDKYKELAKYNLRELTSKK